MELEKTFKELVSVKSDTGTELEKDIEDYLYKWIGKLDYFKEHPKQYGKYILGIDPLKRSAVWGLIKGKSPKTIILMHHHDVVDSIDYGRLQEYAYNPEVLAKKLGGVDISEEVKEDLKSNKWIFGRGTADMKAGAAIQLILLKHYSEIKDFEGNILILSLPDEESLSYGMRGSIGLLEELKNRYSLEYLICINSEPHNREEDSIGILYEGSVGKIMPVIYARGKRTHLGEIFQGLNPVALLAEIVSRIDLNPLFSDVVDDEVSPPPSWSYCKDTKQCYDVSIPEGAGGYFSVLTLSKTPRDILGQIKNICEEAFQTVIDRMNKNYKEFRKKGNLSEDKLPWEMNVKLFSEIYEDAVNSYGDKFIDDFNKTIEVLKKDIEDGRINIPESTFVLIEKTLEYIADKKPMVIIAISPPFYPHVTNGDFDNLPKSILNLSKEINDFTKSNWNQIYMKKKYFMGISDLSYMALNNSEEVIPYIGPNMPHWNKMYTIPFEEIKRISMPIINIGPWGKDLHKFTERVYREDLLDRTPKILKHVIDYLLK